MYSLVLNWRVSTPCVENFLTVGSMGVSCTSVKTSSSIVQSSGLQERYTADQEFALEIRQIAALAFVPLGDVVERLEYLEDTLSRETDPIVEYFEKYYVGTRRYNGERRIPMFPPALWNVHEQTLIGQDHTMHTCNNQEGWHHKFSSTIACHHPTLSKFLDGILLEQSAMEKLRDQVVVGHEGPSKKRKYEDRDRRIQSLVQSFEHRHAGGFLHELVIQDDVTIFYDK